MSHDNTQRRHHLEDGMIRKVEKTGKKSKPEPRDQKFTPIRPPVAKPKNVEQPKTTTDDSNRS